VLALSVLAVVVDVLGAGPARLAAATGLAVLTSATLLAAVSTRGLRIDSPRPARPFVGERVTLSLTARATRALSIHDVSFRLEGVARSGVHVDVIRAGASQRVDLTHRFTQRGKHGRLSVYAVTARPFGLVSSRAEFHVPIDVVALPRPLPLAFSDPPAGRADVERIDAPRIGDEDFYALREWRVGESPRRIHWKATARRGRLVRVDARRQAARPALVVLALSIPPGARPGLFERALRVAAGLADQALAARRPLRFVAVGPGGFELGVLRGRADRMRLLETLAILEGSPGDPLEELHAWIAQHPEREPPEVVYVGSDAPSPAGWIDVRDVLAAGPGARTRLRTRRRLRREARRA